MSFLFILQIITGVFFCLFLFLFFHLLRNTKICSLWDQISHNAYIYTGFSECCYLLCHELWYMYSISRTFICHWICIVNKATFYLSSLMYQSSPLCLHFTQPMYVNLKCHVSSSHVKNYHDKETEIQCGSSCICAMSYKYSVFRHNVD